MIGNLDIIQRHQQAIASIKQIQQEFVLFFKMMPILEINPPETTDHNQFAQLEQRFIGEIEQYLKFVSEVLKKDTKKEIHELIFINLEHFLTLIKNPRCFQMYCGDFEFAIKGLILVRNLHGTLENRLSNVLKDQPGGYEPNKELRTYIKFLQRYCMASKLFYYLNALSVNTIRNTPRTVEQNQELEKQIQQVNLNIEYLRKFVNIKNDVFYDFPIVLEQVQLKLYAVIFWFYKSKALPFDLNFSALFNEFSYSQDTATPLIQMYVALGEFLISSGNPIDAVSCFWKAIDIYHNPLTTRRQVPEYCMQVASSSLKKIFEQLIDWDNSPFTDVLPAFIMLQALKDKYPFTNEIYEQYDSIKAKTQKLKKVHWDQFNHLTKRFKQHDIDFKREADALTLTLTFADLFKNRTFKNELNKLCKKNEITIDIDDHQKTNNLYEHPIEEVERFVNAVIQAKQNVDEIQANAVALLNVAEQRQTVKAKQPKASATPAPILLEPSVELPAVSNSHLYRKELETQKVKQKTRKTSPLSNDNDLPTQTQGQVLGFSDRFKNYTIRPMQMLSNLANRFFVCMTPQASANNDACSLEIRERFAKLFDSPRQCTKRDQQGFKLMRLDNGQLTFVAKILATVGGQFRMYPVVKETNKAGDTLLCFDYVVNKNSRTAKNHFIEEIPPQNSSEAAMCASTSSTALPRQ
ncbi:MAG: hypothetical protein AB7I18_02180 [Candidatus Berkiella sp.]